MLLCAWQAIARVNIDNSVVFILMLLLWTPAPIALLAAVFSFHRAAQTEKMSQRFDQNLAQVEARVEKIQAVSRSFVRQRTISALAAAANQAHQKPKAAQPSGASTAREHGSSTAQPLPLQQQGIGDAGGGAGGAGGASSIRPAEAEASLLKVQARVRGKLARDRLLDHRATGCSSCYTATCPTCSTPSSASGPVAAVPSAAPSRVEGTGEQSWVTVTESALRRKMIQEYRQAHAASQGAWPTAEKSCEEKISRAQAILQRPRRDECVRDGGHEAGNPLQGITQLFAQTSDGRMRRERMMRRLEADLLDDLSEVRNTDRVTSSLRARLHRRAPPRHRPYCPSHRSF